jgi:5'-3' exonuclease
VIFFGCNIFLNCNKKKFYHFKNEDPYKKELEKIDNLLFKIEDPIGIGCDSNYRFKYYNHYFGVDKEELEDFVKELVKNYLIGIRWTTNYYFNKIPDWKWFYPYDYPPFLSDINKYLIDMNQIKFIKGKPISPLEQLSIILPSQMNFLLPKSLSKISSQLSYLYPDDFYVDFLYKHKYFEGIPWLPYMEINKVLAVFKEYKNKLNDEDNYRNRLDKLFKFNFKKKKL